ncbi:50S ribosomal protein L5 [Candidatus Micrarchaeota archaeon]|nr:50S ribosomal protein L5 [Candidatus Micrarchaeota archaeon]
MNEENKMRELRIEKVTVNIGVGSAGAELENAKGLIEKLTESKAVETLSKRRNPVFKLRKDLPIGVKVTLRGKNAFSFIEKSLTANKKVLKLSNIDKEGNIAFGVKEYIDFPGAKYDPNIGMMGFDVCVTIQRKGGKRTSKRRIRKTKMGKTHRIKPEETRIFMENTFKVKFE